MVLFRGDIKSKSLQGRTSISVVLPADNIHFLRGEEDIVEKPYKTVYLLHGLFGSDDIYLANTNIQKFAEDNNIAVVIPSCGNSFYVDKVESHELYAQYVGEELVEFTRSIFPLSHKKEDTAIAGFSMGGYGAIKLGLKYNNTFGHIGAISAALITEDVLNWKSGEEYLLKSREFAESCFGDLDKIKNSDNDPKFLIDTLVDNKMDVPNIFMAIGEDDFLLDFNKDYYDYLKEKNINPTFKIDSGEHTWEFCDEHIKEFIKWLDF